MSGKWLTVFLCVMISTIVLEMVAVALPFHWLSTTVNVLAAGVVIWTVLIIWNFLRNR